MTNAVAQHPHTECTSKCALYLKFYGTLTYSTCIFNMHHSLSL